MWRSANFLMVIAYASTVVLLFESSAYTQDKETSETLFGGPPDIYMRPKSLIPEKRQRPAAAKPVTSENEFVAKLFRATEAEREALAAAEAARQAKAEAVTAKAEAEAEVARNAPEALKGRGRGRG